MCYRVLFWKGREREYLFGGGGSIICHATVFADREERVPVCVTLLDGWREGWRIYFVCLYVVGGGGEICHGKVLDEGEGVLINYLSYFRVGR